MPSTTAPASGYGTFRLHSTRSCLHDGLKTTERESFNAHSPAMRSGLCRLLGFSNDNNRRGRESINPFYFGPVHDLGLALSRRPVPSCGDEFNQARTPFLASTGLVMSHRLPARGDMDLARQPVREFFALNSRYGQLGWTAAVLILRECRVGHDLVIQVEHHGDII